MAERGKLDKAALAPFFTVAALFHAAAVITRFDEVAAHLPPDVVAAIFVAHQA